MAVLLGSGFCVPFWGAYDTSPNFPTNGRDRGPW